MNPSPEAIKAALKEKANMLLPVGTFVQAAIDEAVAAKLKETLEAAVELSKSGDEYQRIIADHLQTIHQLREQLAESRPVQGTLEGDVVTWHEEMSLGPPESRPAQGYRSCPKCACLVQGNRCEDCDVELP